MAAVIDCVRFLFSACNFYCCCCCLCMSGPFFFRCSQYTSSSPIRGCVNVMLDFNMLPMCSIWSAGFLHSSRGFVYYGYTRWNNEWCDFIVIYQQTKSVMAKNGFGRPLSVCCVRCWRDDKITPFFCSCEFLYSVSLNGILIWRTCVHGHSSFALQYIQCLQCTIVNRNCSNPANQYALILLAVLKFDWWQ